MPVAKSRTWMERHVALVVVMLIGVVGVTLVLCAGGLVAMVFHLMRSNPAYTMAMRRLNEEPAIMRRLGEPIEPGWLMTGSTSVSGEAGQANMRIPLKGAKESAEVFIEAVKRAGQWKLTYLAVRFEKDAEGKRVVIVEREER
ncbi:MAG: cytochrome c oxidase assembly factor Coa1 family protein [Phycisphaerales bacterium]